MIQYQQEFHKAFHFTIKQQITPIFISSNILLLEKVFILKNQFILQK